MFCKCSVSCFAHFEREAGRGERGNVCLRLLSMVRAPHTHTIISSPATALPTVGACCEMGTAAASQSPESSPSEGVYLECGERSRRDLSVSGRFPCANLEGYRVNVVVIFTRCGALNTADYPPQRDIAADHRTPTNRHTKPPIPRYSPIKLKASKRQLPTSSRP